MMGGIGREYPILEFDPTAEAIIEPSRVIAPIAGIPEHCVVCFFQDVIAALRQVGNAREIDNMVSEIGTHPLYDITHNGQKLAFFHPGVGGPLAAALLEEVIARGCRKFIACGGAGVLDAEIAVGHIVVPTAAIRDEGTSYHYLLPGREATATPAAVAAIESVLQRDGAPYVTGKTWTTDAIYRETRVKMDLRKAEGCLTVEMETATFFAVAQFRGVQFAQLLYGGDDLSGEWDARLDEAQRARAPLLAGGGCLPDAVTNRMNRKGSKEKKREEGRERGSACSPSPWGRGWGLGPDDRSQ